MSKTLLLADDSVTIQKVVGISFANEDVKLITVDNGDDALVKARELHPDIVLADVVMPGMNGYEVCEAIRADPALRSIPVLLLTGTFEAFDEERAARAGADGHITKPFEAQALVDQVNARLAATATRQVEPEAPSPAAATAQAAPAEATPFDNSFDFLQEEETTEPSGLVSADHGSTTTVLLQDDLDVEPDEAFGFEAPDHVHEELSVSADLSPSLPEEPMPTVQRMDPASAMLPEADEDSLFADDGLHEAETMPPVGLDEPPAAPPARAEDEDATRVVVNPLPSAPGTAQREEALTSVMPSDLAAEAVLDPTGARDYDVSSSDLGDLMAAGSDGDETPPLRPTSGMAPAPLDEDPVLGESFAAAELEPELSPHMEAPPAPPARPPAPAAGPVSSAAPLTATRADEKARMVAPAAGERLHPVAGSGELSPEARRQLHDALEKAAWEAFGDVTERIVREAVARIEQVAWEVIPQMAENVIREEIRRLKEES